MLVSYPDFSNFYVGYASELQVCNWRHGRSRILGTREATWGRKPELLLWCWLYCDFRQPVAQQQEACPYLWESGKCLLPCGGKEHRLTQTEPLTDSNDVAALTPACRERLKESLIFTSTELSSSSPLASADFPPHFSSISLICFH